MKQEPDILYSVTYFTKFILGIFREPKSVLKMSLFGIFNFFIDSLGPFSHPRIQSSSC